MLNEISVVKKKLTEAISQLCDVSWMFVKDGERDLTRKRKLPFDKVVSFLLAMEGGSLTNEMQHYFGCSSDFLCLSLRSLICAFIFARRGAAAQWKRLKE